MIKEYTSVICDEIPSLLEVEDGKIYFATKDGRVVFNCPCGCKQYVILPVTKNEQPNWEALIARNMKSTITLMPSVHQVGGCGSHYFIRDGKVQWC